MTPQPNTCPKCGGQQTEDKHLQALGSAVELAPAEGFLGDDVQAFYCEKCGYVEVYRVERKSY